MTSKRQLLFARKIRPKIAFLATDLARKAIFGLKGPSGASFTINPTSISKNAASFIEGWKRFAGLAEMQLKDSRRKGLSMSDQNACGHEVDEGSETRDLANGRLRAIVYGAAVGDALGVPYEFMTRDTFRCTGMTGGGAHGMPAGTFSDDTSLMLATCASFGALGRIDADDMRKEFARWLHGGAYTSDGRVFDVGNATAAAINQGFGCSGERSNGNGSLMRIAPLALTNATDSDVREVSAITHAHAISKEACVAFVHILRDVLQGEGLGEAIERNVPTDPRFAFMRDIKAWARDDVRSSGYVIDTLGAALWCALNTSDYESCVREAVNLGDDSDTTACVAGALAGAIYGLGAIPQEWLEQLRGKDVIERAIEGWL